MDFRNASIEDAQLLYEWAIDFETRENSFNSTSFNYESHIAWLNKKLEDKNSFILIFEDQKKDIGLCRLEIVDINKALISYSIDKNFRGKGYGRKIMSQIEAIAKMNNIHYLTAKVKVNNPASLKIFESLGYVKSFQDGCLEFNKEIL